MLVHKATTRLIANYSMRRQASNIAFIGLGNMGAHMARNLIKKGEKLKVFDIITKNAESVAGATVCKSPSDVAKGASTIITMLPNGDIVEEALLAADGALKSAPENSLIIDSSTINPATSKKISEACLLKKVRFIDAPVSGGVTGAEFATLTFMVGGRAGDFEEAKPLLLKMGGKAFLCGDIGAGQVTKICNNLIVGSQMIATAEALNLGVKMGLDPKVLTSVVNVSTGKSWSTDTCNPVPGVLEISPSTRDYDGGFMVKLISKDLGLAGDLAISCGAAVPLGALSNQFYKILMTNGWGHKDFGVVYKLLSDKINKQ